MNDLGLGIIVSLKDAFTQNAMRIESSMESLDSSVGKASENVTRNIGLIERGTMAIGAGLALLAVPAGLVASTAATQKALGELASVGVKDFRAMEDAAESFTNQWAGQSKAEFITAAYDVKSALASLSDEAVGTFAAMAALTGKATKATTQEMVETFTTAYGIFKPIMKDMSDMDWARMFSGALSETVGVFKTTGPGMAEAIKNIGAIAAASNVPLEEQMAVLGQLQTTMPGSEAGTLYKSFMLKVAEAGKELGLSFVGAEGKLKGIVPILQELKRGFPDLSNAAAQVKLKKAFGSDEAVRFLLQMSMGLGELEGNITSIRGAMRSGTDVTLGMARAMNMDIGSQLGLVKQQVSNLAEILGRTLLPVVTPLFQGISKVILYLQGVAKSSPGVTRVVLTLTAALGAVLVVVGSVVSVIGTLGIALPAIEAGISAIGPVIAGVGGAVSTYLLPVVAVIAAIVLAVVLMKRAWETNFGGIRDFVMGVCNRVSLAFQGVRALITSLSGGTGQMSSEMAAKLKAAGLLGFVTTVFQVYYRVREYLKGLWQGFSSVFGKIRKIVEPVIRTVLDAYRELGKAIMSVFEAFGMAATAADGSSYRNLGKTLGKVLGVIVEVGAYILKYVIQNFVFTIRVIALVVKAGVWLGKTISGVIATAAPFIYRFFLPIRMLVQAFLLVRRVVYTLWQMISGNVPVVGGMREIGDAVRSYLATPFLWFRDVAQAVWARVSSAAMSMWSQIRSLASNASAWLVAPFVSLARVASSAWGSVKAGISGAFSFILSGAKNLVSSAFESGRRVMTTLAEGIRSAAMAPFEAAKSALTKLRRLLPFSDAKEGPLSALTRSGQALLETFSNGIARASALPANTIAASLGATRSILDAGLPASALAATLVLTPAVRGSVPGAQVPAQVERGERTKLLAVTRGSLSSQEKPGTLESGDVKALLRAVIAKLDGISDRPIDVTVTTKLDGRQIARAVYKDMREQRVKNYETL